MPDASATGAPMSMSPRPCSTCSSTKAARPPSRASSRPTRAGSSPNRAAASANVTPAWSVSARARAGSMAPVARRDPRQATPKRDPSSSANATTAKGRRGTMPSARMAATADNADATPSGPSKAPPPGTESRWLPVAIASSPRGPQ
jgi:hypothetical protein